MKIMSFKIFNEKSIIGISPEISIYDNKVKCKSDTGADISSIHGEFKNNELVLLPHENWNFNNYIIGLQDEDIEVISVKVASGESSERIVVKIPFIYENKLYLEEFTVNDRTKMEYPILLGKNFLDKFLVDVNK